MNIKILFENKELLEEKYKYFFYKKLLRKISKNTDLVKAHIIKAKHNLLFFDKNKEQQEFNDWLIVILYYALYHLVLALIVNKEHISKNHTASIIFLIKHYSNLEEEIEFVHELAIKKEDAEIYTQLKEERHKASYTTSKNFESDKINYYRTKVIFFLQKTEEIIEKTRGVK